MLDNQRGSQLTCSWRSWSSSLPFTSASSFPFSSLTSSAFIWRASSRLSTWFRSLLLSCNNDVQFYTVAWQYIKNIFPCLCLTLSICLFKKHLVIEGAIVPFEYLTHRRISMHAYKISTISSSSRSSSSMISRPSHASYPYYIREWRGRGGGTYWRGAHVW